MSDQAMKLAKRFIKRAETLKPKFREKAIERYADPSHDDIEIESDANVFLVYEDQHQTNPKVKGAWVSAVVWVYIEEIE